MSLSIIHFSDIHIKAGGNIIMERIDALKRACASVIAFGGDAVILVSGDIAFSGKEDEYAIAKALLDALEDYIVQQKKARVTFCFVPGNHDCDFSLSDSVRESLIKGIKAAAIDTAIFQELSKVQSTYRSFAEVYKTSSKELVFTKELCVDGNKVLFVLINSAWMSVIKETPGQLLIPDCFFPNIDVRNYKAVISALHHPLGWIHQDSVPGLSRFLRETSDLLFLGHEHRKDSYTMQGAKWALKQFQAKELQNSEGDDSAFSVHTFDKGFQTCESIDFEWVESMGCYERKGEDIWQYHKNPAICKSVFQLNKDALERLNDAGVLLTHFAKDNVELKDIFVWPEIVSLDPYGASVSSERISENVLDAITAQKITLVIGGSSYGKTSISKMAAMSYAEDDICCLRISGETFKVNSVSALEKEIEMAFKEQYNSDNLEQFRQLPIEERMIIIDDFDAASVKGNYRDAVVEYLLHFFGKILIFLSSENCNCKLDTPW